MTQKETRIPKSEWDQMKKRGIILMPEDYKLLRASILRNCQRYECKQITGAFDGLFLAIDQALQKVPIPF